LEKQLKNLKIPIFILSFVDDSLFISQHKSISISNVNLFYSYNVISSLLIRFGLVVEYGKTEIFYFPDHMAFSILSLCVKIKDCELSFSLFSFLILFSLIYFSFFLFLELWG